MQYRPQVALCFFPSLSQEQITSAYTSRYPPFFESLRRTIFSFFPRFIYIVESARIVDVEPIGLGAILAQRQTDHSVRPVAYASNEFTIELKERL